MKKSSIFPRLLRSLSPCLLLSSFFLPLSAQNATVTCTVNGLSDTHIVLREARGGRLVPVDTLTLDAKGILTLKRAIADPTLLTLSPLTTTSENGQPAILHLILMPKERVTLTVDYMPLFNHFNITAAKGSDNMSLYMQYTNLLTELLLDQHTDLLPTRLAQLLDANPGQLMSAFLVTFFDQQFEQYSGLYKKIHDLLVKTWPENEFVKYLGSRLNSILLPGSEAPDIALPGPDGAIRRLSDLRGSIVLIDFWASWCRPCRMENPNVTRLYNLYHNKGFEIFSVSLDYTREAWLKAIDDDHLVWPNHVSDLRGWSSAGGKLYGIQSIPATVLVDRNGNILARNLRGQELENKLKEIFNEK